MSCVLKWLNFNKYVSLPVFVGIKWYESAVWTYGYLENLTSTLTQKMESTIKKFIKFSFLDFSRFFMFL